MACDGIWEQKSSQDIVSYISDKLKNGEGTTQIIEDMFDDIISPDYTKTSKFSPIWPLDGLGCDNMTCQIIMLNQ